MSDSKNIQTEDQRRRRCPMLGHEVPFSYCRAPGSELPCRKIFDCWWEAFDVTEFMNRHYSREQIEKITAPRQDKVVTLVEFIRQAQQRAGDSNGSET